MISACAFAAAHAGTEFDKPWASDTRALVLDAYEFNEIDLKAIASNKQVAAFINKGSDGLPVQEGMAALRGLQGTVSHTPGARQVAGTQMGSVPPWASRKPD